MFHEQLQRQSLKEFSVILYCGGQSKRQGRISLTQLPSCLAPRQAAAYQALGGIHLIRASCAIRDEHTSHTMVRGTVELLLWLPLCLLLSLQANSKAHPLSSALVSNKNPFYMPA